MATAFRRHPKYFDTLYCNLIDAGGNRAVSSMPCWSASSLYMEKTHRAEEPDQVRDDLPDRGALRGASP